MYVSIRQTRFLVMNLIPANAANKNKEGSSRYSALTKKNELRFNPISCINQNPEEFVHATVVSP